MDNAMSTPTLQIKFFKLPLAEIACYKRFFFEGGILSANVKIRFRFSHAVKLFYLKIKFIK